MIRYLFTLLVLTLTNLSAAESMKLTLSETAGACSEPRPENRPSEGSGKRAEEGRRQIELFSRIKNQSMAGHSTAEGNIEIPAGAFGVIPNAGLGPTGTTL